MAWADRRRPGYDSSPSPQRMAVLQDSSGTPSLHVLLVEDSEHDARAARRALEKLPLGCRVTHCVRGEDALEKLQASARWYDVVLVDHGLPGMTGLDLCKQILSEGIDVPIVMLTGGGGELVAVEALKMGVSDYLVKDANRAYHEDRAARLRAESELHESQELFRSFMNNSPAIAYMKAEDGKYVYVNAPFERLFGMTSEDWKSRTDAEIWGEETARQLRENDLAVLAAGETLEVQETMPHEDGMHHWLAFKFPLTDAAGARHVGGMAVDITETKRAEEERRQFEVRMQQGQKLESLGVMAGGIAHDFNNLLVSILGNAGLALMELGPESSARKYLQQIEKASLRAAELTDQMLSYSGKGRFMLDVLDVSRVIEEMAFVLKVSISKKAVLKLALDSGIPDIEADPGQLRQAINNLVTNASEALQSRPGTITLATGSIHADQAYLASTHLGEGLPEGPYVWLEVADTGVGIDPGAQARIFDPFFTTKFTGRGLGLAAVLGIVRGHHGCIAIDSEPGRGTAIRILFPATEAARDADVVGIAEPSAQEDGGTVLVVDDEEAVRTVARLTLQRFGYEVLAAESGAEAVAIFREHADRIVAVLLDVTMPGMNGEETMSRMREIRKEVKVILSSGYDEANLENRFRSQDAAAFLKKPYRPLALIQVLHEVTARR